MHENKKNEQELRNLLLTERKERHLGRLTAEVITDLPYAYQLQNLKIVETSVIIWEKGGQSRPTVPIYSETNLKEN